MGNILGREKMDTLIHEQIIHDPVVVYSKSTCVNCTNAKRLLKSMQIPYACYELNKISGGIQLSKALKEKTGCSTVPQIFICGHFIGGYNELYTLTCRGLLIPMVSECAKIRVRRSPEGCVPV
uniref:Glutaredoxin domain-containing protein n=1 Tax=Trichuris muris TaxID=70415 RepID=A0A5S6QEX5_TRIMR